MTLQELFKDKSTWGQGRMAVDKNGAAVWPWKERAARFCLAGGMQKCYNHLDQRSFNDLNQKLITAIIKYSNGRWKAVTGFNDNSTFEDIRAVVELANV